MAEQTAGEEPKRSRKHRPRKSEAPARQFPKVTLPAPHFAGTAVIDNQFKDISLADFKGNYLVLVFYPMNFTFVCPSELTAFSDRMADFKLCGTQIVACAPDSQFGHQAFIGAPRQEGGLGGLAFPLLSDFNRKICRDYNVLVEAQAIALRAIFIIDRSSIIRHMAVNDLAVGRNVEEALRIVKAFQFYDEHGDVCPVNWKPGDKAITPDRCKAIDYFDKKYSK